MTFASWSIGKGLDARILLSVSEAGASVGVCEEPPGSNRGPEINLWLRMAGTDEGQPWCAAAVGAWWRAGGLEVPRGYASCDNWLHWARETKRFHTLPGLGSAVLYGKGEDASHIGLVVRVQPLLLSIEGNTTVEGAAYSSSREGVVVSLKEVTKSDPVLGYVMPFPGRPTP